MKHDEKLKGKTYLSKRSRFTPMKYTFFNNGVSPMFNRRVDCNVPIPKNYLAESECLSYV